AVAVAAVELPRLRVAGPVLLTLVVGRIAVPRRVGGHALGVPLRAGRGEAAALALLDPHGGAVAADARVPLAGPRRLLRAAHPGVLAAVGRARIGACVPVCASVVRAGAGAGERAGREEGN